MRQTFVKQTNSHRLTLLFAGWGMDATLFADMCPTDSDLLVCYDYTTLAWDATPLAHYREVKVVAWSMGVWAATQVLCHTTLPFTQCIAIGGTPFPIDEQRGIAPAIFNGTLATLNERNLIKFNRRMCLPGTNSDYFNAHHPQRTLDDLITELRAIGEQSATLPPATLPWSTAIVGGQDLIFVAANQLNGWQSLHVTTQVYPDEPHFCHQRMAQILRQWQC